MDAEVSFRLKYGRLSCGRLVLRLMAVSSEKGSVVNSSAAFLFSPLKCWYY